MTDNSRSSSPSVVLSNNIEQLHKSPTGVTKTTFLEKTPSRKRKDRSDAIDKLLVMRLQEKKPKIMDDEEAHFGKQIAANLRRFNPQQKSMAKLQIQQTLTQIEFTPEFLPQSVSHIKTPPITYYPSICNTNENNSIDDYS